MKRRELIAVLTGATMLTGCGKAAQTFDSVLATVVDDAQTVAASLATIVPQLGNFGLSTSVQAIVSSIIDDIKNVADQLSGTVTQSGAKPLVQKLASYVNSVVQTLAGASNLSPTVRTILSAVPIVVQAIVTILGIAGVGVTRFGGATSMTPEQARATLKVIVASNH